MHAQGRSPPRRVVGLDVNDTHIAGAQVGLTADGTFCLEAAGWVARPATANRRQTADLVRSVCRQAGLSAATVCTSLPSHSLVVRRVHYPWLQENELPQALGLDAEEALQMPRAALDFDWHCEPAVRSADASPINAVLIAAPKKDVDEHLHMLLAAGICPHHVTAGCLAIANLYLALKGPPPAGSAVCVAAPGERRTDICVLSREQGILPRTVLARPDAGADAEDAYLIECVIDTLKYHAFKLHGPAVASLVLTGTVPGRELPSNALRNLAPAFTVWNPIADLTLAKPRLQPLSDGESGLRFATSIGLALQGI